MSKLSARLTAITLACILVLGSAPGSVLAADAGDTAETAVAVEETVEEEIVTEEASDSVEEETAQEKGKVEDVVEEAPQEEAEEETFEETPQEESVEEDCQEEEASPEYYTVILDANGGYFQNEWDDLQQETIKQAEVINKLIPFDGTVTTFPVFEADNATGSFLGWSLEEDGELVSQGDEEYAPVDNCVLYAVWEIGGVEEVNEAATEEKAEEVDDKEPAEEKAQEETAVEEEPAEEKAEEEAVTEEETPEEEAATEEETPGKEEVVTEEPAQEDAVENDAEDDAAEDAQKAIPVEEEESIAAPEHETQEAADTQVKTPIVTGTVENQETVREDAAMGVVESGTCGDNLTWTLDEEGTLTISGTGEMDDYGWSTNPPWNDYKSKIINVTFSEGIESIGNYAFRGYTGLASGIVFPADLIRIGNYAFADCTGLTGDIIFSEGLTDIGNYAFSNCTGCSGTLSLPSTVTAIGDYAFSGCKNLRGNISLYSGLNTLGSSAFGNCSKLTGDIIIPDGISEIGSSTFRGCSSLDGELQLPAGLTKIGSYAFRDCSSLTGSLEIPDKVKTIGSSAFYGCSGFTSIFLGCSVSTIENSAFRDCKGLQGSLEFPTTVTSIEIGAFYNCPGLTGTLIIPMRVFSLGSENLIGPFDGCSGLENIILHSGLAINSDNIFDDCDDAVFYVVEGSEAEEYVLKNHPDNKLEYITDEEIARLISGESGSTGGDELSDVIMASGTCGDSLSWVLYKNGHLSIEGSGKMEDYYSRSGVAWSDYKDEITIVTFGEGIESIGSYAFSGYTGLHCELIFPSTLKSIGNYAFKDCAGLTGSLTIPEGVASVGNDAFENCTGFRGELSLPSTLTSIGNYAFSVCKNLRGSINLGSGLTTLGNYAFYKCSKLTGDLVLPNGLATVGNYVFKDCSSLNGSLTLPAEITSIGTSAFRNCSSITGVLTIPDSVKTIESDAFNGCSGFTGVSLGNNIAEIKSAAFRDCTGISGSLEFPTTVTSIEIGAFYNCSGLTGTLIIPMKVSSLGKTYLIGEFGGCSGFENIVLHSNLVFNGSGVFSGCDDAVFYVVKGSEAEEYVLKNHPNNRIKYIADEEIEKLISDRSVNPAAVHTWNGEYTVDKEATCTEEGTESIHCSVCGVIDEDTVRAIPKKDHAYGEWTVTKEATCTEEGSRERVCTDCGEKALETIPAKGHAWNEEYTVDKEATCTEEGSESIHCSVCNTIDEDTVRVIPKKDHAYGKWAVTKEATCTEEGSKEKVCADCGEKASETIPATGHTWNKEYTVDKDATCTEEGYESIHCSVCGFIDEDTVQSIQKKDHAYGEWTVTKETTCTEEGIKEKVCADCGEKISETIPATGHTWNKEYTVDKESAYPENGSESIHCSVCGAIKEGSERTIIAKAPQSITASDLTLTFPDTGTISASGNKGSLTYKSENTAVATVDSAGKVTAKGAGTAKITITAAATDNYNAATKTITVTVNKAAQSITASNLTLTFPNAGTIAASGNKGSLTYKSDNPSIAAVDSAGKVTAKGAGTAKVTIMAAATDNYNAATKTITVTVNKAAQSITAKAKATSVAVGKTTTVAITGAQGTKSYKSSDTSIATVNSSTGLVTARKVGTVKITATSAATANYKAASKTVTIKVVPGATTSLSAANQAKGIKLAWKKVAGATGYIIYINGNKVATINSGSTVTYTRTQANTNGKKYVFKVVAKAGTGTSTLSKSLTYYKVARPAISSITNSASKKMTVKWEKNAKATGYQIQYSTSNTFASGNKSVKMTKNSTVLKVIGGLTKGKTYYVRIRTYKTVGNKTYNSAWSASKTVKISK